MATCRIWCSRYGRVNKQAHSPDGGAPQERQELNLHLPGFGDQVPIRWLIPINNETARDRFPGRLPYGGLVAYMATVLALRAASSCDDGFMHPYRFGAVQNVMDPW